eukprot:gene10678-14339_t
MLQGSRQVLFTTLSTVGFGLLASYYLYKYYSAPKKLDVVFVLGQAGSGKGTNCNRIVECFGYIHLCAGDLLRAERASKSHLSDLINSCILEGKIVSPNITVELLRNAMLRSDGTKFIIDGFPRDMENLRHWKEKMSDITDIKFLLFLDCPNEVLLERCIARGLTSGRSDDNEVTIKKKLLTFEKCTLPVVDFFRSEGLIREVNSNRSREEVFSEVSIHFSLAAHNQ